MPSTLAPLHERLLHAPPSECEPPPRRASSLPGILVVSLFVLYHVSVLLVWNGPGKDLAAEFQKRFLESIHAHAYFRATRNDQSWAMFAPNPDRTNNFVKVFVVDQRGDVWDFGQDLWGVDRYPYLFYDRRGKVNRNIDGKKHSQRIYGAWVCREWERQNGGEAAQEVRFIKWWTDIPAPELVIEQRGWDPWGVPHKVFEQETITCKTAEHGTLPNELRARYGLPAINEDAFRPVEIRTWVDEREAADG